MKNKGFSEVVFVYDQTQTRGNEDKIRSVLICDATWQKHIVVALFRPELEELYVLEYSTFHEGHTCCVCSCWKREKTILSKKFVKPPEQNGLAFYNENLNL